MQVIQGLLLHDVELWSNSDFMWRQFKYVMDLKVVEKKKTNKGRRKSDNT